MRREGDWMTSFKAKDVVITSGNISSGLKYL